MNYNGIYTELIKWLLGIICVRVNLTLDEFACDYCATYLVPDNVPYRNVYITQYCK